MKAWMMVPAAGAMVATVAAAQQAPEPIDPASWITTDDYPPGAIRREEEGLVVMILSVDAAGKLAGCRIDVSSGSEALDRTSCDLMRRNARFAPARDRQGRKVAGSTTKRVMWRLPDDGGLERLGPLTAEHVVNVDAADFPFVCSDRDRSTPERAAQCLPSSEETSEILKLIRWARADMKIEGGVRLHFLQRVDHGAGATATLPGLSKGEAMLREVVHRFDVDVRGVPSACAVVIRAQRPGLPSQEQPTTPCDRDARFVPAADGTGAAIATTVVSVERATISALSTTR